jgi:GNAT superfamily N-acetyltransferase
MDVQYQIHRLNTKDRQALARCFAVFSSLRPHLDEARFIEQAGTQFGEGYEIAYIESDGEVVAAAGYRVATFLAWGRVLYIDDLVARPEKRRAGLGGALLDWLIERGRHLGCDQVHLDTGYQRHDAHRLYLKKGFVLKSHHMSIEL